MEEFDVVGKLHVEYGIIKVRRAARHEAFEERKMLDLPGQAVV